jgi:uncharacterized damage-inducible protein DinB
MNSFFKDLFEYNHHVNQQIINLLTANPAKVSDRNRKLVSHMLNAHQVWNCKFIPGQERWDSWQVHPLNQLAEIDNNNFEQTIATLDKFKLDEVVTWSTAKGQTYHNTVRDILFQVISHSTYHRGQIATECRESGLEPVLTDYIFYKMK